MQMAQEKLRSRLAQTTKANSHAEKQQPKLDEATVARENLGKNC
jgi:hypothetical protein